MLVELTFWLVAAGSTDYSIYWNIAVGSPLTCQLLPASLHWRLLQHFIRPPPVQPMLKKFPSNSSAACHALWSIGVPCTNVFSCTIGLTNAIVFSSLNSALYWPIDFLTRRFNWSSDFCFYLSNLSRLSFGHTSNIFCIWFFYYDLDTLTAI